MVASNNQASRALIEKLGKRKNAALLNGILRGVEREALRVNGDGTLALSPHPLGLGSALTHPQITTDFSEALLEFITPPSHRIEELFEQLWLIQRFVATQLGDELLWTSSMPCMLGDDNSIPVAQYGSSNNARMKTTYRIGLGHRYGRAMQTIAGVHYNFSLPDAFWAWLHTRESSLEDLQDYKDNKYFAMIRNFRRYFWLLIYLFGASPATCKSFVKGRAHDLESMAHDDHTLYKPWATSLRMGDLGYQSSAQENLYVCYNLKRTYINTLCRAITTPWPAYEHIGLKDSDGEYRQLNTGILQIENEFYSAIRPKRTAKPGETALMALCNRGVEYVEVRCLDIDPFNPAGINPEQLHFLDVFLLWCALSESPPCDECEATTSLKNQKRVVNEGRKPDLKLIDTSGEEVSLRSWAKSILNDMQAIALLLDNFQGATESFQQSLSAQIAKVEDSELTPSARFLRELRDNKQSYAAYTLALSKQHSTNLLEEKLAANTAERFRKISELSLQKQRQMEEKTQVSFDLYLEDYYRQYKTCCL